MSTGKDRRRTTLSWLFVAGLFVLCGVLGVLQYRWIGEVSVAARDRLRGSLQASLNRLSLDFNSEIAAACRALLPAVPGSNQPAAETEVAARYAQWKKTAAAARCSATSPSPNRATRPWYCATSIWIKRGSRPWSGRRIGPPQGAAGEHAVPGDAATPRFPRAAPRGTGNHLRSYPPSASRARPPGRRIRPGETPSLIFDLNPEYARDVLLPELLQRHLETGGTLEYQVEVLSRQRTPLVVYQSDPGARVAASADASVGLFETPYDQIFRRASGPGGRGRGPGAAARRPDSGRWQMFVRHRAGSLEAVVAQARWRNLAVTAGVLLLMMASVAALITYTRRAQKLADLQMDFVAGISHELRTPLTVIHTAAYNLRGKLAANPAQVERYGVLIQQESGRLKDLVEQVLRFSGATAGRVIQNPEPLSVPELLEDTLESARPSSSRPDAWWRSTSIPTFPRHGRPHGAPAGPPEPAPQCGQTWRRRQPLGGRLGIRAARRPGPRWRSAWPIADPESPPMSRPTSSNPSFAAAAPSKDQIHGTGLGLNLAMKIVQAHGGSIQVKSAAPTGPSSSSACPPRPPEIPHECAHTAGGG
jgi:signal transduction histidine kinase